MPVDARGLSTPVDRFGTTDRTGALHSLLSKGSLGYPNDPTTYTSVCQPRVIYKQVRPRHPLNEVSCPEGPQKPPAVGGRTPVPHPCRTTGAGHLRRRTRRFSVGPFSPDTSDDMEDVKKFKPQEGPSPTVHKEERRTFVSPILFAYPWDTPRTGVRDVQWVSKVVASGSPWPGR